MHSQKSNKIFAIISISVFGVCLLALIILYALGKFGELASLTISLIILASLALILFSAFMVMFINKKTLFNMLEDENEYSLGERSQFNNISTFIHNATVIRSINIKFIY